MEYHDLPSVYILDIVLAFDLDLISPSTPNETSTNPAKPNEANMDPPEGLLIVNEVSNTSTGESPQEELISLPQTEDFSFSSLIQYANSEFEAVDADIKNITLKLNNSLSEQLDQAAEKQKQLTVKMVKLEKLAHTTLSETTARITTTQYASKDLNSKLETLTPKAEAVFDRFSRIIDLVQKIQARLPESDSLGHAQSTNASQYPKLHKLLASKMSSQTIPYTQQPRRSGSMASLVTSEPSNETTGTSIKVTGKNEDNNDEVSNEFIKSSSIAGIRADYMNSGVGSSFDQPPPPVNVQLLLDSSNTTIATTTTTDVTNDVAPTESDNISTYSSTSGQSDMSSYAPSVSNWRSSWLWQGSLNASRGLSSSMSVSSSLSTMTDQARSKDLLQRIISEDVRAQSRSSSSRTLNRRT